MGVTFLPFLEFDDCRASIEHSSAPPFSTAEPEALDLTDFVSLTHAKDYTFYSAIAGVRSPNGFNPLFSPRGLPPNCSSGVAGRLDQFVSPDDPALGWLFLDEVEEAMRHASVQRSTLSPELVMLLHAMSSLEGTLGQRRVRLVFGFT